MTLPNLNEAIADLGGRVATLLWRLQRRPFRSGRVVLAGIRRAHRDSLMAPALLSQVLAETIRHSHTTGVEQLELSW